MDTSLISTGCSCYSLVWGWKSLFSFLDNPEFLDNSRFCDTSLYTPPSSDQVGISFSSFGILVCFVI